MAMCVTIMIGFRIFFLLNFVELPRSFEIAARRQTPAPSFILLGVIRLSRVLRRNFFFRRNPGGNGKPITVLRFVNVRYFFPFVCLRNLDCDVYRTCLIPIRSQVLLYRYLILFILCCML